MMTKFSESYPSTNLEHVEDFERQFSVKLPDDYRDFLLATNGGRPIPDGLEVPSWPGKSTRVHFFFGLHDGEHNNLRSWTDELGDQLPTGCVPVAVDMGGNFLILATEERRGEVYYWDASPDYDLSEEEGTLFLLSSGIDGVLDALTESPSA